MLTKVVLALLPRYTPADWLNVELYVTVPDVELKLPPDIVNAPVNVIDPVPPLITPPDCDEASAKLKLAEPKLRVPVRMVIQLLPNVLVHVSVPDPVVDTVAFGLLIVKPGNEALVVQRAVIGYVLVIETLPPAYAPSNVD